MSSTAHARPASCRRGKLAPGLASRAPAAPPFSSWARDTRGGELRRVPVAARAGAGTAADAGPGGAGFRLTHRISRPRTPAPALPSAAMPPPLPRDLPSLTSLRALAALMVFVFHLVRWQVVALPGAGAGETGVAFFFVLSGFVLTWGHAGRLEARRFHVRRFARVWPSHAVMWAVALTVAVTAEAVTWPAAVVNLLLLQGWIP